MKTFQPALHYLSRKRIACTLGIMSIAITFCLSSCSGTDQSTQQVYDPAAQQRAEEEQRAQQQALAYKNAITVLLQNDSAVGAINNDDAIRMVPQMRQLDLSQCPHDFAGAYVDHIHAWEKSADIEQAWIDLKSDENMKEVITLELLQKIFGSDDDALDDLEETKKQLRAAGQKATEQISSTFNVVERIAVSYGAPLPKAN